MIVTTGKQNLLRVMAGLQNSAATHMVLGIGTTAAAVSDTRLDYEVLRLPLLTSTPDYVNNTTVFKATIPAETAIDAYEVGIVSSATSPALRITDFSEPVGFWSAGSASSLNSRVSGASLLLAPGASTSTTATGTISVDWTSLDEVLISYFVGSNVASASIRFLTDGSNYYSFSLPVTAGYRISRIPKASFTATGTPSTINQVAVLVTATAGGTAGVYFDSISAFDIADVAPDLLARRVLASNLNKAAGLALDVEYSLGLT